MNTTTNAATLLDLDALMDTTLDAVANIPDYVTPPNGLYRLGITEAEIKPAKEAGKAARIVITYKVIATIDCDDVPVVDNSLFNEGFMGTQQGLEYFKKAAIKIMNVSDLDGVPLREILSGMKDQEFDARITVKITKGEGGKEYENVQIRPIHIAA